MKWSLEEYCNGQIPIDFASLQDKPGVVEFLISLNLPSTHPFCELDEFPAPGVAPMGNLGFEHRFDGENAMNILFTLWMMVAPPLLAMAELWIRLFAGVVAPAGTIYLILYNTKHSRQQPSKSYSKDSRIKLSISIISTVLSSLVVMTDTLYCLENGPIYGAVLFTLAVIASLRLCFLRNLSYASCAVFSLVLLSIHLIWQDDHNIVFGDKVDQVTISEGLYYDKTNPYISDIVTNWPETFRTYDKAHGASLILPTGDSRTGIPFLVNHLPNPEWKRLFLDVDDDEYVALDISFPPTGHNKQNPVYLILHGLNGGSNEEYVRDFTIRRNSENSTVVVMVARGLMDLPIKGYV
jgi:hypothetical protein